MFGAFVVLALLSLWSLVVVTGAMVYQVERSRHIGQRAVGARLACHVCGAHVAVITNGSIEPAWHPSRRHRAAGRGDQDGLGSREDG